MTRALKQADSTPMSLDFRSKDADEELSGKGFTASLRLKNAYNY
jgi:hypothetical protein